MRLSISALAAVLLLAGIAPAFGGPCPACVDEVLRQMAQPKPNDYGFTPTSNASPEYQLQVCHILGKIKYRCNKVAKPGDTAWKACMRDAKNNMYARLCAAYFLLDTDKDARAFVEARLVSPNLRHRYNAAKIVQMYVDRNPAKTWGIPLLIRFLSECPMDENVRYGFTMTMADVEHPRNDFYDIHFPPIDDICWDLGILKTKEAVPAIISVLERDPDITAAASALGEIGDRRAVPVLLKTLSSRCSNLHIPVIALGQMRAREAVPVFISRLENPGGLDCFMMDYVLEALLAIGDKRAIPAIENFLRADFLSGSKPTARRVLAQMDSPDPVKSLLALLATENNEFERGDLIQAMAGYKDPRAIKEMESIARFSKSAFMRRKAILSLAATGTRESLLALASLLSVKFPNDLDKEHWWKESTDFANYFPRFIASNLKECTKRDFGTDRAKWEKWIAANK